MSKDEDSPDELEDVIDASVTPPPLCPTTDQVLVQRAKVHKHGVAVFGQLPCFDEAACLTRREYQTSFAVDAGTSLCVNPGPLGEEPTTVAKLGRQGCESGSHT